ncbi:MAG: hypothetical protein ACRDQA_30350 [Nocardioidaceae bacterium]
MTSLRDSLQAVYDQRGALTPALVVDEATPDDHPLHSRFEWDDSLAGPRYREVQARELIRSVRIVYRRAEGKRPERSTRYWQSVRGDSGHVYKPTEEIAQDEVLTQIVLRDMEREWKQLKQRYGHFAEFAEMVRADVA